VAANKPDSKTKSKNQAIGAKKAVETRQTRTKQKQSDANKQGNQNIDSCTPICNEAVFARIVECAILQKSILMRVKRKMFLGYSVIATSLGSTLSVWVCFK
jgi:hypothetical protein